SFWTRSHKPSSTKMPAMPTRPAHQSFRKLIPAVVALALAACARSGELPLPTRPELAGSLAALRHENVNVAAPLSVSEVALLAVQNNQDLRAARAQHGVAQAQILQAGLLPNPQVT